MTATSNTDDELWYLFKEGDTESFAAIYQLYFKNLYEYGSRIIDDKDLVRDSIHDLFVKLWANKLNLGEVKNLKSYLIVSLRRAIYNKAARNSRMRSLEEDNYDFEMSFSAEIIFMEKESISERSTKLLHAISNLGPRQKEVIYLKYFEELNYDEIATAMGITTKATYKLYARALNTLKEILTLPKSALLLLALCSQNFWD